LPPWLLKVIDDFGFVGLLVERLAAHRSDRRPLMITRR
jgi:hypothetical protein